MLNRIHRGYWGIGAAHMHPGAISRWVPLEDDSDVEFLGDGGKEGEAEIEL